MKNHSLRKRIVCGALALMTAQSMFFLSGCSTAMDDGRDDGIELIDPVNVSVSCVAVERRNFYDMSAIYAICSPQVTESSFTSDINFYGYESMPGETVKEGDVLISGYVKDLDDKIKAQNEKLADMESEYNDSIDKLNDTLAKDKSDYDYYSEIMERLNEAKPLETDPAYEEWMKQNEYNAYDGKMRYAYVAMSNDELQIKEKQELYALDSEHEKKILQRLLDQKKSKQLIAPTDGTVIALNYFDPGNYIAKNTTGMAVGNTNVKEIRSSYISQSVFNKAKEVYAIKDGKRYEVEYHPINNQEYELLNQKNGKVYSTFSIDDPDDEIKMGDYLVIVLVNDIREQVLSVPKSAVGKDATGEFVYVFDGESYKERYIRTGASDGAFTEILSGVEENETVKCDFKMKSGASEAVLKKGSVNVTFTGSGVFFYPSQTYVTNDVKYGVTYFDEMCVSRYEVVEKGQVIAKVHVVADSIEADRTSRQIQRLNENIAQLQDDLKKKQDAGADKFTVKDIQKNIKKLQDQAADLNKVLSEMRSDAALKEIVSPIDGIVTDISRYNAGDIINPGDSVARVSSQEECFIVVEDRDGKLSFGNTVEVGYKDENKQQKTATGTVVTANPMILSESLTTGYALIKMDPEVTAEIAGSNKGSDGWWNMARFSIKAEVREMKDVILIPRSAVTEISGSNYVTIKEDNGSMKMVSFVTGGSDSSYYWAVEGVEEGQTVCWE